MSPQKSLQLWTIVLLGLFHISIRCDARAVNVSNTWTMPQEGLNVFYRFFRDRISWFEADAVCQFHHANLVTVDNSFQFDATRDLLRELDVNDIVWIGLMRPQNSEHFMWSNSRPLVTDTGYWAESLPLMESPLCAVIDPIRDYRWHALRCGGPETASFLCEMPVPSWADACILRDMPNLTMQYMADTASIELIRNCAEEGLLRQTCKGKQDREIAIRELICPRERLEAQRINDITNSHFKSLQIINSIRTDNNENNDIELLPLGINYGGGANSEFIEETPTEKNTVQRLIEQFNVDELMQADEPAGVLGYRIPGEIPKPVKKTTKKVIVAGGDIQKKPSKYGDAAAESAFEQTKAKKQKLMALHDMMMGDQPLGEPEIAEPEPEHDGDNDDVSNEIMEPLPHKKKILPQDLKTMATITEKQIQIARQKLAEEQKFKMKELHVSQDDESSEEVKERRKFEHVQTTPSIVATSTATTTTTTAAPTTTAVHVTTSAAPSTTTSTTTTTTTATTTREPVTATTTTTTAAPTTTVIGNEEQSAESDTSSATSSAADLMPMQSTTSGAHPTATMPPATIGHPMHPQQPRSNIITEETQHSHVKESADNSHFIPPMLLVKSHYVPPTKHGDHHEHDEQTAAAAASIPVPEGTTTITTTAAGPPLTATAMSTASADVETLKMSHSVTSNGERDAPAVEEGDAMKATHERFADAVSARPADIVALTKTAIERAISHAAAVERNSTHKSIATTPTMTHEVTTTTAHSADSKTAIRQQQQAATAQTLGDQQKRRSATDGIEAMGRAGTTAPPPTPMWKEEQHVVTIIKALELATATDKAEIRKVPTQYAAIHEETDHHDDANDGSNDHEHAAIALTTDAPLTITTTTTTNSKTASTTAATTTSTSTSRATAATTTRTTLTTTTSAAAAAAAPTTTTTTTSPVATTTTTTALPPHPTMTPTTTTTTTTTAKPAELTTETPAPTHDFMKEDTETPFKPNRRRSLTKPETVSYFKKILG